MQKRNESISYAMDFSSYLIKSVEGIERIILHGSISRGDFDEKSDIDLFIDTTNKKLEKTISKLKEDYSKTEVYKKWKLKGIEMKISIIVGKLEDKEWANLKRAITTTGILLYGKLKSNVEKTNQYILFSIENIRPDKKRVAIHRKIYGYTFNGKKVPGLIDEINGIKLGKNIILVPAQYSHKIKDYLKSKKVVPKIYDLWSDVEIKS
ncbi:hypothetical protein COU57_00840 [Candidatus Pacearchaeota archaeon CG10_big_fil_rev_8_21_14_0_10_32_14]|nr:MAG: hypothetical protein COU57_00840 [Candidatus Pacearchaeota archaeon CG10_big_fil_rev_8_21_14_0_10_32_14]